MFDTASFFRAKLWLRAALSGEKCALCGENTTRGRDILCDSCRDKLTREASWVCPRCGALVCDCTCVPDRMAADISAFVKLFPYCSGKDFASNRVLYRLKKRKDGLLCEKLASELAPRLVPLIGDFSDTAVTYVPRNPKKIRANGTDQARELARAVARALGCPCVPAVKRRRGGGIQKELDAAERVRNAASLFSGDGEAIPYRCAVLVDDLVTTGATVSACAAVLRRAGVRKIVCAAVSHTVGEGAGYFPSVPEDTERPADN